VSSYHWLKASKKYLLIVCAQVYAGISGSVVCEFKTRPVHIACTHVSQGRLVSSGR
jgi:hypothetical protein